MASIPFEVMEDILCHLPVKPLKRFRCVAKSWRCLIDSERFAKSHLKRSLETNSHQHIVVGGDKGVFSSLPGITFCRQDSSWCSDNSQKDLRKDDIIELLFVIGHDFYAEGTFFAEMKPGLPVIAEQFSSYCRVVCNDIFVERKVLMY